MSAKKQMWQQRIDRMRTQQHHIAITGLSRSGKSTLFTSLMAQLLQSMQAIHRHHPLPLLHHLPIQRLQHLAFVDNDAGVASFPYLQHFNQLAQRRWPESTRAISGFAVRLAFARSQSWLPSWVGDELHQLNLYDYPGEWLMDLPLIQQSFVDWSAQVMAQQLSEPQRSLAQTWQQMLAQFDFEQSPTAATINQFVQAYRTYLHTAKAAGISIIQPGAMLFEDTWDWQQCGFFPLPAKVAVDISNPWTQLCTQHYGQFVSHWLLPLQKRLFNHADKQIILLDILEGLHFGKDYLLQIKEALNHLVKSFVYGKRQWYERWHKAPGIMRVAFVATKLDLVPLAQQSRVMLLLKDICQGALQQLAAHQVEVDFFLLSSVISTKPTDHANDVMYKHTGGETRVVRFDDIPTRLSDWRPGDYYPYIQALPPKITQASDIRSMNIDQLFNYMLAP